MQKSAASNNRKFNFRQFIGITAVILLAAVFISALPNIKAQAENSSFFGLANLFTWQTTKTQDVQSPQAILIDPATDGGFESGFGTFTVVNNATGNMWFTGSAAGASAGTNAAFIGSNATTYTDGVTQTISVVDFIYKDITFPAGEGVITLTFDYKQPTLDGTFDLLRVFLVPTTTTITAGTQLTTGQISADSQGQGGQATFGVRTIVIPASAAGTTQRLVFQWKNDAATPYGSGAIDNISLVSAPLVPVAGTKTIDNTIATGGNNYNSFTAAINDLNTNGVGAGGVTFNVATGQTFTETTPCITAEGTVGNPIVFQKSGAGANPIIQPPGTAGASDAGICISGGDFITVDGIDVTVAAANTAVEYGYFVVNGSTTNGAKNNTIQNSKITLNRTNINSFGIIQSSTVSIPTADTGANSNNRYYNITVENASRGILLNGGSTTFRDSNNEIGVTSGGATVIGAATANDIGNGTASTYGIAASLQFGVKIFNTEIRNVTGTGTSTVDGILLSNTGSTITSVGTNNIFNNKIHDLNSTNTTTTSRRVVGIREDITANAGSVVNVYNNFVYNLQNSSTSTITTTRQIVGILAQIGGSGAGSTHNIDFNSVRIESTNLTSQYTAFETGTSTPVFKIRNNIFSNFTGAQTVTTAKHYAILFSSSALGASGSVSNYNDLYVSNATNGFVARTNTTDYATLAAFQTATGFDANSISADPQFVSATDLHVNPASPVVNAGTDVGILQDIDGQNRVPPPDIGADEPGGVTPVANDIAATAIVTPANGSTVLVGTIITPQATFTNVGTNTQTNVMVQFTITGPGGYSYTNTQTIATIAPTQSITVTFAPAPAVTAPGTYNTTATVLTADGNAANNTVTGTFNVPTPIAGGTYSVPSDYPSLTNPGGIFEALNASGASGNVTINITADLSGETGANGLNQLGSGITVLIKPTGGAWTISGTASGIALIKLNGADNVTIDGSQSGGTDRSLTINNTSTAVGTTAVWLSSLGTNAGAMNNTVKNVNLTTSSNQATGTNLSFGIFSGGSSLSIASDGLDNDGNTFQNNFITSVRYGIYVRGGALNTNDNVVISQNLIGPATFGSNEIGRGGIVIQNQNAVTVSQNEIRFVGGDFANRSTFGKAIGIGIGSETGPSPITTIVTNSTISRNLIHDIVDEKTGSAIGIEVGEDATAASVNTVANNMIYNVRANGTSADQTNGISIGGGNGDKVVFNSISLTGDLDPVGSTTTSESASGIRIVSTTPVNLTLMNNAISVDVNSNTATLRHYAFVKPSATYSFGTGGSDYNDYYVNPANAQMVLFGNGTTVPYTNVATLALFQAEMPAHDANSKNVDPLFMSNTDLHLQTTSTLIDMGITIAGVTVDFDGQTRDAMPDIGADEIVQVVATPTITVTPTTLPDFGTVTVGMSSASQSYSLTGSNLTADIVVTAPTDFQVSLDNVNFSNTVTVTQTGGTASATIYVRFTPLTAGMKSGNVTNASTGATTQNVAVSGTGIAAPVNNPPTITAVGVTRQQGSPASNSTIANVTDDGGNGAVVVTVTSANPSNGVTISNILNTNGVITADVVAACNATNATFTLQASDGTLTTTTTLTVTVTANTAPTLSYPNASVASGGTATINPATGPSDNGNITSFGIQSTGGFMGGVTVNGNGDVIVNNAMPVGTFTITIRVTDNCNAFTDASFTLTVSAGDVTPPVITYMPIPSTNSNGGQTLVVTITDAVGVTSANIFYRVDSGAYTSAACTLASGTAQNGTYNCTIPGQVSGSAVAYYVTAADAAGNTSSNPTAGMSAPNLYSVGSNATIPAGTYTNLNIGAEMLGGNVTVLNNVTLDGITTTGANTLTIDCNTTVTGAGASNFVVGNVKKNYCATETFVYPVGDNTGTPEYSPLTAEITAFSGLNPSLTVSVVDAVLPGLETATAASRYWNLTETGDLTANLLFNYVEADTADPNVNTDEVNYKVFKNEAGTVTAQCAAACVDVVNNTAGPVNGVMNFSAWGIGVNLAPLAASVDVGGRVLTQGGRGIPFTRVIMSDSQGGVRTAYTNQFGYYRFSEVPAGETYVVTAINRRYTFNAPSQVFFAGETTNSLNFIAAGENPNFRAEATFFDRAPLDFDGDGRTDVSVFRQTDNTWYIKRSSDDSWYGRAFGAEGDRLAPADYDGDGKTDVAVYRPSNGTWYILQSATDSLRTEVFGDAAGKVVAADYDGDRKADLAIWNAANGIWQVKLSSTGAVQTARFGKLSNPANVERMIALVSDYDGDGKADQAIFDAVSGSWTIRLSADGKTFVQQFGQNGDRPLAGDFDADGIGDTAVYRAADNAVYVKSSSGGEQTINLDGAAGKTIIGDFDGDGKTDAGVFRNGVWNVRQSNNAVVRSQQFGLPTDTVIPSAGE